MLAKVRHHCVRLGLQTINVTLPIAMDHRIPSQRGALMNCDFVIARAKSHAQFFFKFGRCTE